MYLSTIVPLLLAPLARSQILSGGSAGGAIGVPASKACTNQTLPANWDGNCNATFTNVDDILRDQCKVPNVCLDYYIIQALSAELDDGLKKYNDLLKSGYDDKFNTYADYSKDALPGQVRDWMAENATKSGFFKCTDDQKNKIDCPTEKTPLTPTIQSSSDLKETSFDCTDQDGFFDEIEKLYAIDKSWIKFGDFQVETALGCVSGNHVDPEATCAANIYYHGWPTVIPKDQIKIPNPKDAIGNAMQNYTNFQTMLSDATIDASIDMTVDNTTDIIDGSTVPVFLLQGAIDSMNSVVDEANQIDAEKTKEAVLWFITGVLMVLPFAGEASSAAGFAMMGRIIATASDVGDAALGVYTVVQDPKDAIFAVFAGLGLAARGFREAAVARRAISSGTIKNLGPKVSQRLAGIDKITKKCS